MRVKVRNGYVGGRIRRTSQAQLDAWADEHKDSKSRILEFLVEKFLTNESLQKEYARAKGKV